MRVLVLHSRYLSDMASGENRVVEDEIKLLRANGHDVHVFEPSPEVSGAALLKTAYGAVWSNKAVAHVRDLIRKHRIEVTHCHNLFPALSPAVIRAAATEGSTVVMTLHNYRMLCLGATFLRDGRPCEDCIGHSTWRGVAHRCYRGSSAASATVASSLTFHRSRKTFDKVHLNLATSEFVKAKHVQAGWDPRSIRVKSNFTWESPRRVGPGDHFLYIGRLSVEKGLAGIVKSWTGDLGKLVIVGDGPERDALEELAPPSVQLIGSRPSSEIPRLLRDARALLLPALSFEGAPRGVLEAFAAGVPVIASRIGSIPELVENEVSGLLVAPRVTKEWHSAARSLLKDDISERLAKGAHEVWNARFNPSRAIAEIEECYEEAHGRAIAAA